MAVVELVDEREVLVALLPRQFIDADRVDAIEAAMLEAPANGVLDAAEDGVPARAKPPCALHPREHARPARDEPHERVGRVRLARRPRHQLDHDAAAEAVDPTHRVHQRHGQAPERHEREVAGVEHVVAWPLLEADRAESSRPLARLNLNMNGRAGARASPLSLRVDKTGHRL